MSKKNKISPQQITCIGVVRTKNSKRKNEFKKRLRNCVILQRVSKINYPFYINVECYLHNIFSKDADNIAKLILDSLNGVVFIDDRYCLGINIIKRPQDCNMEEKVLITLMPDLSMGVVEYA